jgi:PAS domain S-box-containing protein
MVELKPQLPKALPAILRYGLAVLTVSLALGAALFLQELRLRDAAIPLFLFAGSVSAWYGGPGAALVALVLSCVVFDYFFVAPIGSFAVTSADIPYFVIFISFEALVSWFSVVRRRVEGELRRTRDNLQREVVERTQQANLLNLTHDTVFVRDMNEVITYWNRGAQELYGWTSEEAVGKRAHELLHTIFPAPIDEINAELLRTGRWDGELVKTRADGTQVVVSSRWSLRRDDQGRPDAILATNNDITDRRRREDEVRALNEELGKRSAELEIINKELEAFAYSVSHDLRAPLRHMSGFTELLQKSAAGVLNEKSLRYVAIIMEAAKRMGNLIDDLLSFSRIGRAETHKTAINLEQLVREALADVRPDSGGRDIVWKIGELPNWYGDRSMLRLAFVNLISNAVKFTRTRPQAEIEIGCREQEKHQIVVFVRDNGVGFDMKYLNKLFGVFQRLHPTEAFEGTGIGLATVQRIVHRHGGRVWAEGLVDKGATFYFSLSQGDPGLSLLKGTGL